MLMICVKLLLKNLILYLLNIIIFKQQFQIFVYFKLLNVILTIRIYFILYFTFGFAFISSYKLHIFPCKYFGKCFDKVTALIAILR